MISLLFVVAIAMIILHEAAHVLTTLAFGGRFEGVTVRHVIAVGVKIRVDALSTRQIAATLIAAPVAEALVISAAILVRPEAWSLWLLLLGVQWAMNLVPWPWFPNDGRKLWLLTQHGRAALAATH